MRATIYAPYQWRISVDLPAMKMEQSGTTLYLTQMSSEQLISHAHTQEWDPDLGWDIDRQGFQRAPVARHYEAIGRFLSESTRPFIPTAALLSAEESQQGRLPFIPVDSESYPNFGTLRVPEGRQLVILDYQHRHRGLRYAIEELGAVHLKQFRAPVIIVPDIPRFEEIRQFYLINSKQRRIDTDLALALLQTLAEGHLDDDELYNLVGRGKRFRVRGTSLTFSLAARERGPWKGRIAQPHDLPQPGAVIKVKSFVDSLAPIVSRRAACSQLEDAELLDVLSAFWAALRAMVPAAFKNATEFQIQKTVGVYTFHLVFARRVYPNCAKQGSFSVKAFQEELTPASKKYLTEEFWRTKGEAGAYAGSSGHHALAKDIMALIPDRHA